MPLKPERPKRPVPERTPGYNAHDPKAPPAACARSGHCCTRLVASNSIDFVREMLGKHPWSSTKDPVKSRMPFLREHNMSSAFLRGWYTAAKEAEARGALVFVCPHLRKGNECGLQDNKPAVCSRSLSPEQMAEFDRYGGMPHGKFFSPRCGWLNGAPKAIVEAVDLNYRHMGGEMGREEMLREQAKHLVLFNNRRLKMAVVNGRWTAWTPKEGGKRRWFWTYASGWTSELPAPKKSAHTERYAERRKPNLGFAPARMPRDPACDIRENGLEKAARLRKRDRCWRNKARCDMNVGWRGRRNGRRSVPRGVLPSDLHLHDAIVCFEEESAKLQTELAEPSMETTETKETKEPNELSEACG